MRMKALLLTMILLLGLIPVSALAATFEDTGYYMTYWPEDLTFSDTYGAFDTMASLDKTGAPAGCTSFLKAIDAADILTRRANPFTAEVYIPEDGTYYIWGCGWGQAGGIRWMHFGFDYSFDENTKIGAQQPEATGFIWSRTQGFALSKGWHKLTGYGNRTTAWLAGLLITDDAELTLDTTVTKAELDAYGSDKTPPVLSEGISYEKTSGGGIVLTLPTAAAASDASGRVVMTYKVNSGEVAVDETGIYTVDYAFPFIPISVEVTAADWHGNKTTISEQIDVEASGAYTYLNLWPENFTLPTAKDSAYTIQTGQDLNLNENKGAPRGVFLRDGGYQDNSPATAEIFIPKDGDYYIWGCGGDNDTDARRHALIGFDGAYDSQKFGSNKPGFEWRRSEKAYTLTAGWHTVDTYAGYATSRLASVVVTDDPDLDLSQAAPPEFLEACADLNKPTITQEASAQKLSETSLKLTLPAASDDSGHAELVCSVNGKPITPDADGFYIVEDLIPLAQATLEVIAKDHHGNASEAYEKSFSTGSLQPSSFEISRTADGVQAALSGAVTTENLSFVLAISVYTKDLSRMEASAIVPVTAVGARADGVAGIALSEELASNLSDYVVQAVAWDSMNTAVPIAPGISKDGSELVQ